MTPEQQKMVDSKLYTRQPEGEPPVRSSELVKCDWMEDELDGYWRTSCGDLHQFTDGGPENNNHKFCPYCGKTLHAIHCQAPNDSSSATASTARPERKGNDE